MKKFYSFITIILAATAPVAAKSTDNNAAPVYPHYGSQGSYNAISNSRLIAKSHYIYSGSGFVIADTVKYLYTSNARGGTPSLMDDADDGVFFDSSFTYVSNSSGGLQPRMSRFQEYQQINRVSRLTMAPWSTTSGNWKDSARFNYTYDVNSYITVMLLDLWFGGTWSNHVGYSNNYVGSSDILISTISPDIKIFYFYDANNNLTNSYDQPYVSTQGYVSHESDSFYYDSYNRPVARFIQRWEKPSSMWVDSERWSYTYQGSTSDMEYAYREMYLNGAWQQIEMHTYTYDPNHNRLTDITATWDNGVYSNSRQLEWTYNQYNQPTQLKSTTWDGSSWASVSGDYLRNFFYQSYQYEGINDVEQNAVNLLTYPVPALDHLTLDMTWKTPQSYSVSVFDLMGKLIYQSHEAAATSPQKTIPAGNIPPGSYFVRINGDKGGQASKNFIVTH